MSYYGSSLALQSDDQMKQELKNKAPVPWIGMYVAAASLVCSLAMAADLFHGFRHKKLWFPCKFFTLNAGTLTLLAVAMKLPIYISTAMPTKADQLAKLSSTIFMSTAMGNLMPSLGTMDDREILMNLTALGILVITIFVNVCIQLHTGLLSNFLVIEHIAVMLFMLVLLVILSFSALTVPTTKKHMQLKYAGMHKLASSEELEETEKFTFDALKRDVKKYWMLAETSSPQFVMARSMTSSAAGAICFLTTFILVEASLKMIRHPRYSRYFSYPPNTISDYGVSTVFIYHIQRIGVLVGTIAQVFRWFIAAKLRLSEKICKTYKTEMKTENYWIARLVGWKEGRLCHAPKILKKPSIYTN
ncbi:uncharacterized protein LOC132305405 [Cornus florida]|uniref:uncharacterized protein LOC132305405 n=1 Tax=Cornus florida TaxID=4283 RepID=UPI00289EFD89|nr:uncharacterized protein LOC132305405 [Cornus florida]